MSGCLHVGGHLPGTLYIIAEQGDFPGELQNIMKHKLYTLTHTHNISHTHNTHTL